MTVRDLVGIVAVIGIVGFVITMFTLATIEELDAKKRGPATAAAVSKAGATAGSSTTDGNIMDIVDQGASGGYVDDVPQMDDAGGPSFD